MKDTKIIEKKIDPKYFSAVKNGKKRYEIRLADEKYRPGQYIRFREYDRVTMKYTGRSVLTMITYVVHMGVNGSVEIDGNTWWKYEDVKKYGLCIFGIEIIESGPAALFATGD